LDVSRNELWGLPSSKTMQSLINLETLNLSRNWFEEIPLSIRVLQKLKSLNVSHNMLRSSEKALLLVPLSAYNKEVSCSDNNNNDSDSDNDNDTNNTISIIRSLEYLEELNLEFNNKCNHQKLKDKIEKEINSHNNKNSNKEEDKDTTAHTTPCYGTTVLKMTINVPPKPREKGFFVGDTPSDRDPTLLRSQLECWSTTKLRRRLVADFGQDPLPENCGRSVVMDQLLTLYANEYNDNDNDDDDDNNENNNNNKKVDSRDIDRNNKYINKPHQRQRGMRKIIRTSGTLIQDVSLLDNLLRALKIWKMGWTNKNNERSAITAENYMILTSPESWDQQNLGRHKRKQAETKLLLNPVHYTIWTLSKQIMTSIDDDYAQRYTALAVTHNFEGSPHIDRQNVCPFYGLSVGDFDDGTGGIMVECSARIVAHTNTKNRLSKVDGRFPHWVAPYDNINKDRYSVIFYETIGTYQKVGTSIFNIDCD